MMDKSILSNRSSLVILSISVVVILMLSIAYVPFYFEDGGEKTGDKTDWENYPYVIPDTDMRFPDEEGQYPKQDDYADGKTWISVGTRLDPKGSDMKQTYLVGLYQDKSKDIFLSTPEETHKKQFAETDTGRTLPEGKMDMTFQNSNTNLPPDRLKLKEGEAFYYDFRAHFVLNGTDYELDVELEAEKPPATMTDFNGEIRFGDDFYRIHSLTHCRISGTFKIDGDSHEVGGLAWIENQRGSSFAYPDMKWDWFACWTGSNTDLKIVDVEHSDGGHKQYGMYVDRGGEILTIDNISIEVTSVKNKFGYSWEITSEKYQIDLNITCIDERMHYGGFAMGLGRIEGYLMGGEIDTLTYVELTNSHQP